MAVSLVNQHCLSEGPNVLWGVEAGRVLERVHRGAEVNFKEQGEFHQVEEGWETEGIQDVEPSSKSNMYKETMGM